MSNKTSSDAGFALIDALVGLSLAAILCTAFLSSIYYASVANSVSRDRLQASIAQLELYEIAVGMSLDDFAAFNADLATICSTDCHFELSGGSWEVATGPETVDGRFERSFSVQGVTRDGSGDITGTQPFQSSDVTIEFTTTVDWTTRGEAYTDSISTYLHEFDI